MRNVFAIRSPAFAPLLLIAALAIAPAEAQTPDAAQPKIEATPDGVPPAVAPPLLQPAPLRPPQAQSPQAQSPQAQFPQAQSPQVQSPHGQAPPDAPPDTAEQRAKLLGDLYARLAASPGPEDAEIVVKSIERLWLLSGSATADLLLDRALAAANANNQDLAMKLLDAAVLLQPDFAEAWNRRAYLYFMKSDYKRALGDLRRVLALEPNHFHALEGLAQILRSIGEKKAALDAYKKLLAVNPQAAGAKEAVDELTLEVDGQGI